MLPYKIQIPTW